MNYTIETLEKERDLLNFYLDRIVVVDEYTQTIKLISELEQSISILKCVNDGINPFSESASVHGLNLTKCQPNQ